MAGNGRNRALRKVGKLDIAMSLQQIKQEIAKLPRDEVSELQAWLNQQEREEELADLRLAAAVNAGKFDKLIDESDKDREAGRSRPL